MIPRVKLGLAQGKEEVIVRTRKGYILYIPRGWDYKYCRFHEKECSCRFPSALVLEDTIF
jgi:hypothetical protein